MIREEFDKNFKIGIFEENDHKEIWTRLTLHCCASLPGIVWCTGQTVAKIRG